MNEQQIDQKHLELGLEMVRRQLEKVSQISAWDLHFTLLRTLTNQFFCQQRPITSYICTPHPTAPKYLITVNDHASLVFHCQTLIVP